MLASRAGKFLCSRLILGTGTLGLFEQPGEGPSQLLSYTGAEKVGSEK